MNRILIAVAAAGLFIACGDPFGPGNDEVVAALMTDGEPGPQVFLPDTVRAGQPFAVAITTYHICRLEEGRTAVDIDGLHAMVVPYNRFLGPSPTCADFIAIRERAVEMQFDERGPGTVTVIGLSAIRYPGEQADTIRVTRGVVVR
ncbi:hypothetical protein [Candidatus Palauibacter sp.]|uniref:hypothetical protein n=1 Tax=Candidatus Palauibacter sp. TaxID=3101350 RepID=UPI003B02B907